MQNESPSKQSLRCVRESHGSLRQISRQAGIDPGQLSKVERGQASLSVDALHRLAKVLGLSDLATILEGLGLSEPAQPDARTANA